MPPLATTASNMARPRAWISLLSVTRCCRCGGKLGTPCINFGVRRGRGPPGLSFSLLYSLHGGAIITNLTKPDHASRRRTSKVGSCRISCWALPSRSKGSKHALRSFCIGGCHGVASACKDIQEKALRGLAAWLGSALAVLFLNWGCARVRLHDASPGQRPLTGSDFVRCA